MGCDAGDTLLSTAVPCCDVPADDPGVVHTLAVTTDDVVTALEANRRREAGAVLRVTPPFAGRMRARLHIAGAEGEYDSETPQPLHVRPERLVEDVPSLPTPDETEDEIRADPDVTYSTELHRRRHAAAVDVWRESVREAIVETTTVEAGDRRLTVRVTTLG